MIVAHAHWFWDTGGHWYVFWSGFGSCLTEFGILGVVYRRLNCHTRGCWRLGLHHVDGTPFITCRRHHPIVPNRAATADHIHAEHAKAQGEVRRRR